MVTNGSATTSFYVCNWYPEHGPHLVAGADLVAFSAFRPAGRVFQSLGTEDEWSVVRYGADTCRVDASVLKPIPAPAFGVGDVVSASGKLGVVADVFWHFKDAAPIYFLEFGGKRSSRRYSENELAPA